MSAITPERKVLSVIARLLSSASHNRFGKVLFDDYLAREELRLLAVRYDVAPSATIIEQVGKVAVAALAKAIA